VSSRLEAGIAALNDLERERYGAWVQVLSTWSADAVSKAAAVSYFEKTVPEAIASLRRRLDSRLGDDVYWQRWCADAAEVHRGIADVMGYRREWSMLSVLTSSVVATAGQLGTAAQSAVKGAGVGAGAVVFVVGAFLAWKAGLFK
jgi:hypothetical protein